MALTLLTADSFNRADSALSDSPVTDGAGTLDPQSWGVSTSTFEIVGNQLIRTSGTTVQRGQVAGGELDIQVQIKVPVLGAVGVYARYTNTTTNLVLHTNTSGGIVVLDNGITLFTGGNGSVVAGDTIALRCFGSDLTVLINDVEFDTYTETNAHSGTNVGFRWATAATGAIDDFAAYLYEEDPEPPAPPPAESQAGAGVGFIPIA